MAAKPQMTIRLAPSIVHAVEYLAERDGTAPAELVRTLVSAAAQRELERHGWSQDCQAAYMRALGARGDGGADPAPGDLQRYSRFERPLADTAPGRPDGRKRRS